MHSNNIFLDSYILLKSNYDNRMIKIYGNCGEASYGFIKKNIGKYNSAYNMKILNPNYSSNNSSWFGYHYTNKKYDEKKLILINNQNNLKKIKKDKFELIFQNKNYGHYKILNQEKSCFFLEKYD